MNHDPKCECGDKRPNLNELFDNTLLEAKNAQKQIKQHIEKASEELEAAETLARKHGLQFSSNISRLYQSYIPKTVSKWNANEMEQLGIYDCNVKDGEYYDGWQHSAVC
jgi:hypothetical protein